MRSCPALVLTACLAMPGCSPQVSQPSETITSQALLEWVDAIWEKGGDIDKLVECRKVIELRIATANDNDYALARAQLHSVPVEIKGAGNYYEFVEQLAATANIRLHCDPRAKERLVGQKDPPAFSGVGSALDALMILERQASSYRLGLIFGKHPGRLEVVPAN